MKILAALVLSVLSYSATAEESFPTGTFKCVQNGKEATVTINDGELNGLPYISFETKDFSGRGLASVVILKGFTNLVIPRDFQNNVRLVINKEGTGIMAGSFGACELQ